MLQPAEAVGITCLLIDELAAGVQGKQATILAALLEDLAAYSHITATRIENSHWLIDWPTLFAKDLKFTMK